MYSNVKEKLKSSLVIWGHSGIGKSYLYRQNREDIIDFDFEYKGILSTLVAFPDLIKEANLEEKTATSIYNYSRIVVDKLFDLAIEEANQTKKKLLVSDLRLLKERSEDFDIILNIPEDIFIERTACRGLRSVEAIKEFKKEIDSVILEIKEQSKIFTIECYLEQVLQLSEDFIEAQEASNKKKNENLKAFREDRIKKTSDRFKYLSEQLLKIQTN